MADKDLLKDARQQWQECVDAEAECREESLDDIKFARLGEQWGDADAKQRRDEGRPMLTINRLPAFARQVVNDARQNKPSIKVRPVDDQGDPAVAEVLNGVIRNIEAISGADIAYDTAVENAVYGGIGYLRCDVDYAHDDSFDLDIKIARVANPFSVYGDPHSTAADGSDWMRAFVVDRYTHDEFKGRWKGAEVADWDEGDDYTQAWVDENTVQVAEWWTREESRRKIVLLSDGGVVDAKQYERAKDIFDALGLVVQQERETLGWTVRQRIITASEVLEDNEWAGQWIPLIPVYGEEIWVEGKRYWKSLIRDAKDSQRMLNYWRSASTELVALAPKVPFIGPRGAFSTDAKRWATANRISHPYLEYDGPVAPARQPLDSGAAAGALQEAMAANDDIKSILGLYDASLGQRSNETSGRAILARQREGDTSTFHFIDNMARSIRQLGRVIVDLIPHVYNGPRVLRVLGEDGSVATVPVNQPIPQQPPQPGMSPQQPQQPPPSPLQQATQKIYDLSAGRYDVVVEAGPSFTTKREEAAVQMVEFLRAYPPAAPVLGDLLAKNLDWPGADEIARRLQALLPPPVQGVNPQVQQMQQLIQQLQGQLGQMQADRQLQSRKLDIDARKADIDAYDAETKRAQIATAAMTPEQVQALVLQTLTQVLQSPDVAPPPAPPMPMQQPMLPPQQ